jgi:hypothetical protein
MSSLHPSLQNFQSLELPTQYYNTLPSHTTFTYSNPHIRAQKERTKKRKKPGKYRIKKDEGEE